MTKNNSYNVLVDMGQDNAYSQPATIESDGLEFQDFSSSQHYNPSYNSPSHTSPPPPPPPPPPSTSAQHNMSNSNFYNDASPRAKRPLWSLDFYSQFFDVDTTQVLERCLKSMYPRGDFAQDTLNHQPDLYGPFWIPTSVVFTVFVCSSLAGSLAAYIADREFFYDFNLLGFSVGVVYLYAFLCPVVFWACTKWFKCDPNLLEIINYYGYGLTIWIPVSLLCIIPYDYARWSFVGVAWLITAIFLVKNLYLVISRAEAKISRILLLVILLAHTVFALVLKIAFYSYNFL